MFKATLFVMGLLLNVGLSGSQVKAAETQSANEALSDQEVQSIAEEALIFGLPLVMNYTVMHEYTLDPTHHQYKAPFNTLYRNTQTLTPQDTAVVTPNADTPYSMVWLDLRREPMVISVPKINSPRYYSVMFCDGNTYNYGLISNTETGREAGDYLAVAPDWQGEIPPGIKAVFRATTPLSIVVFRTQLYSDKDTAEVKQIVQGYGVQPLSQFLNQPAPAAPPPINFPKIDRQSAKQNFFFYLDFVLSLVPESENEREIRAKLRKIGIGINHFEQFKAVAEKHRQALLSGVQAANARIDENITKNGIIRQGWIFSNIAGGNRDYFAGNWLNRASLARAGIYALNANEAVYPLTRTLADGEALNGKHRYTITFAQGALPPVSSFWSITSYDGKSQFLVDNPINRYLINSPMLPRLKKNPDGSITLYLQKDAPSQDQMANWLPVAEDAIYLVLRLYGPKAQARNGEWQPPFIEKVAH